MMQTAQQPTGSYNIINLHSYTQVHLLVFLKNFIYVISALNIQNILKATLFEIWE